MTSSNWGLGFHATVTPPPQCPQKEEGQSLLDTCPHLAGRMVPFLKTPLPKWISCQPAHEAQGAG